MDYLLQTIKEGVVDYETRADPDDLAMQWIAINCGIQGLPREAGKYRLSSSHRWSKDVNPDGTHKEMDYASQPDWWLLESFWNAFIPVNGPAKYDHIWYNKLTELAPTRYLAGDYYLLESALAEYRDSQSEIWSCVLAILDCARHPRGGPIPITFDFSRQLNGPFRSRDDLQRLVTVAKRLVLLQLAYIYWWISCWDDWEETLGANKVEIIKRLDLPSYGKRGVIFDCQRDWTSINLPFLVEHRVPLFYSYGPKERNDDRFAFLDPKAMHDYQEALLVQPVEARGNDVNISHSFNLYHRFRFSRIYDQYCQPSKLRYQGNSNPEARFEKGWIIYIIDFWGWRRRLIEWMELVALYAKLFHFSLTTDTDGNTIVTFWRWRRRFADITSSEERPAQLEHPLSLLRELYKGKHAPRPGQFFDEETGVGARRFYKGFNYLVKAAPLIDQDVARFKQLYQCHDVAPENVMLTPFSYEAPPTPAPVVDEPQKTDASMPVDPPEETSNVAKDGVGDDHDVPTPVAGYSSTVSASSPPSSTPSLLNRLTSPPPSPAPSFHNKISRRHKPYPKASPRTAGSQEDSESVVSDRPVLALGAWQPARPAGTYEQRAPPMERPGEVANFYNLKEAIRRLWVYEFGVANAKITYEGRVWKIDRSIYKWNPSWLEKGVLLVDAKEQVLMRYWCNVSPQVKTLEDLLYLAVERGIQFKIAVKEADRSSFRKADEKISDLDRDVKKQYSQDYVVPPLTWKTGPAFRDDYVGVSLRYESRPGV